MTTKKKNMIAWKGAVKGLNITIIVLASIAILISIISLIYIGIAIFLAQSTEAITDIANNAQMGQQTYIQGSDIIIGQSQTDILSLANIGFAFMMSYSITSLILAGFSMFVAIYTLLKVNKKHLNKKIFALNVASAIGALITINVVRFIVLTVNCVYIFRIIKSEN